MRRELSLSLKMIAPLKFNHDVVVPRAGSRSCSRWSAGIRATSTGLRIPCFGHAGDGNIHVNIMVDAGRRGRDRAGARGRAVLFEGVVALEGSISGEHGIGFAKAPYLRLELSADEIALMKRVKRAFDPHGILNPGKDLHLSVSLSW